MALLTVVAPAQRWALFLNNIDNGLGTSSRTVALLATASGDAHADVADQASSYLKAYLDSMRTKASGEKDKPTELGDARALPVALLSLCLGSGNAEAALARIPNVNLNALSSVIDVNHSKSTNQQLILSFK